jgi:hypothetical protein
LPFQCGDQVAPQRFRLIGVGRELVILAMAVRIGDFDNAVLMAFLEILVAHLPLSNVHFLPPTLNAGYGECVWGQNWGQTGLFSFPKEKPLA